MKLLLLNVFACLALNSFTQTIYTSDCNAPDSVRYTYLQDAQRLAVRWVHTADLPEKDSIAISQQYTDTFLDALLAIYNIQGSSARDSVVNLSIHTLFYPGLNTLAIGADSNYQWIQNLQHSVFPTGYATLDDLIQNKGFSLTNFFTWTGWYHFAAFQTDSVFNIQAIVDDLNATENLYFASDDMPAFDGPDIVGIVHQNHVEIRFIFRWGDCPAGCLYAQTWIFNVYDDCSVEHVVTYNGEAPDAAIPAQETAVYILPNPFNDYLSIAMEELAEAVDVYSIEGTHVLTYIPKSTVFEIPTNTLAPGNYIVCLQFPSAVVNKRIIKN